jgi:hypothetical protein
MIRINPDYPLLGDYFQHHKNNSEEQSNGEENSIGKEIGENDDEKLKQELSTRFLGIMSNGLQAIETINECILQLESQKQ